MHKKPNQILKSPNWAMHGFLACSSIRLKSIHECSIPLERPEFSLQKCFITFFLKKFTLKILIYELNRMAITRVLWQETLFLQIISNLKK